MIPTDIITLKRLDAAWKDPEVTRAVIQERFHLNSDDWRALLLLRGPRERPATVTPWRLSDELRDAGRRGPRRAGKA